MASHSYPTEWLFAGSVLLSLAAVRITNPLVATAPVVLAGAAQYIAVARRRIRPRFAAHDGLMPWSALVAGVAFVLLQLPTRSMTGPRPISFCPLAAFGAQLLYSMATLALVDRAALARGGSWVTEARSPWLYWIWVAFLTLFSLVFAVGAVILTAVE